MNMYQKREERKNKKESEKSSPSMSISWYPGHMAKSKRMIQENLSLVDAVIELLDARIPFSSRNPDIDELAKNKRRVVVLNKADMADPLSTEKWLAYFGQMGFKTAAVNSIEGKGIASVNSALEALMADKVKRMKEKGYVSVTTRAMILGIPNVGKSAFINKYVGKAIAKTGDKPGVTRGKQWIKLKKNIELLDTPGILWPKFEDKSAGLKLAFCGSINDDILNMEELACEFIKLVREIRPDALKQRYKTEFSDETKDHEILYLIGEARGFRQKGGEVALLRTADMLIDEFRAGKLGKLTLELPPSE